MSSYSRCFQLLAILNSASVNVFVPPVLFVLLSIILFQKQDFWGMRGAQVNALITRSSGLLRRVVSVQSHQCGALYLTLGKLVQRVGGQGRLHVVLRRREATRVFIP